MHEVNEAIKAIEALPLSNVDKQELRALVNELSYYERTGRDERAEQVLEQIEIRLEGIEVPDDVDGSDDTDAGGEASRDAFLGFGPVLAAAAAEAESAGSAPDAPPATPPAKRERKSPAKRKGKREERDAKGRETADAAPTETR